MYRETRRLSNNAPVTPVINTNTDNVITISDNSIPIKFPIFPNA